MKRRTASIACGLALAAIGIASSPALGAEQWIVAPAKNPQASRIAKASGARLVDAKLGIWTAPAPRAHRLAAQLKTKGLLRFQERDQRTVPTQAPSVSAQVAADSWWRAPTLGAAGETPITPTGPQSAPIAIIESGGFDGTIADIPPSVTLRRPSTDPADDQEHGTMVASVIAGRGPSVYGVTPNADVRDYGFSGYCSDAAKAIRQAVDDGARVINMSYGFAGRGGPCLSHEVATSYASSFAVIVASAGNERAQPWTQPANDYHVLTVGSLNAADQPTFFSNQSKSIDISAPGEGIGVACPLAFDTADGAVDGHCTADGTSFSAPIVAAVAARVIAARPELSASQVQRLIAITATDIGNRRGWDISTGYGKVNLAAALAAPAPIFDPLEPNDDIEWLDGRHFSPDAPLLRRGRYDSETATLDALKDPMDVYPVWVGPGEKLSVTIRPEVGRVIAGMHFANSKSVYRASSVVIPKVTIQPGRAGRLVARNYSRRATRVWIAVYLPRGPQLLTYYRLILLRGR